MNKSCQQIIKMGSDKKRKGEAEEEPETTPAATGKDDEVDVAKKRRRMQQQQLLSKTNTKKALEEIPASSHYQVSFMHRATVTHVVSSTRHGYVVTACEDGAVKFWKRISSAVPDKGAVIGGGDSTKATSETSTPCLEFVKSFTAHSGPVASLCIDPISEDTIASVGQDGLLKFYDVSTFDATAMIRTSSSDDDDERSFGFNSSCFLLDATQDLLLAIGDSQNGNIYVYSTTKLGLVQTLTLHSKPVTALAFNVPYKCCVSCDQQGIIEIWDTTSGGSTKEGDIVGATCTISNNKFEIKSKMNTDLYKLAKNKTYAKSIYMSINYFVVYGGDHKIRIFDLKTCKVLVRYDERLQTYSANKTLDSIEFGKRAATEREMEDNPNLPSELIKMDPTEQFLFISTVIGIKVIRWQENKVVRVIGKADASQLRYLSFCLCLGDAKMNQQMQLARGTGQQVAMGDANAKKESDALVVALAYQQRRFYVFSHIDPLSEEDSANAELRDVWNEAPTAQERLLGSEGMGSTGRGASNQTTTIAKAILRTTMGDIHIKLFANDVPKTIENFVGHARSGYYDNVVRRTREACLLFVLMATFASLLFWSNCFFLYVPRVVLKWCVDFPSSHSRFHASNRRSSW